MLSDILTVDWERVRFKRAASGFTAMLLSILFAGVVGDIVLSGVMATLFVIAAGGDGPMESRLPGMVRFTVYGALIGGLAFWSADTALAVAVVLGVATYAGTLSAVGGARAARSGLFLTLWALIALMLGDGATDPWRVSLAFVVGGVIAISVTALRLWASSEDEAEDAAEPGTDHGGFFRWQELRGAVSGPIGVFAVARAVAVIVGVLLGFWWFASYPLWVAVTVIVVLQPSARQSASVGIQRTIGTALGVGVAVLVAQVFPQGDTAVVVAFLVSGLLMVAFMSANYTLMAAFLTAMLVFGQRLAQADAFQAGWDRLLATSVGALIAFGVIGWSIARQRRRSNQILSSD